jgi:hypothetical protein
LCRRPLRDTTRAMSATLPQPLPPWAVAPLACGVMTLAFAIAYPLSRTEPAGEGVSWPAVFPSAAINYPPSEDVGGFIISVACVLMSYAFLIRHVENAARLGKEHVWVNHGALVVALVGMVLCPLGVVAYPWHLYPQTHFFWAYSLFYLGVRAPARSGGRKGHRARPACALTQARYPFSASAGLLFGDAGLAGRCEA